MKSLRGLGFLLLVSVLLLFVTLGAVAQQQTQSNEEQPQSASPAAEENAGAPAAEEHSISVPDNYQGASGNEQQGSSGAAPVLGHPLDPADVDTLTGKNDQRRQVGPVGGAYYGYPMSTDWFGTPQFGTRFFSGAGSQFFSPFLFGGINPLAVGGFGRGRNFGPNSFVFAPSPVTPFFLGGPHFATPGVVFSPGRNWNFGGPPRAGFTGSQFGRRHQP